jgi:hypothetical protein
VRRFIAVVVLLGCAGPLWAQSLAEVVAREKKRRETQAKATPGKPVPSYGDDDLKGRAPDEPAGEATKASGSANRPSAADPEPETAAIPRSGSADDQKRQMADSIRVRLLTCHDEVTEARDRVKALESYLANLQPRFFNNLEADRHELERLLKDARADVERTRRRCDDIEDEARKASIPAGWIR